MAAPTFFEKIPHRNIRVVYLATSVLSIAYGMALALTPILLEARSFPATDIGSLASFFGLGLVSFAVPAGAIVRKVTPRLTLAICMAGYATTVFLFPHLRSYFELGACRFFDGAFSVGVWLSFETLLLRYAVHEWKAFSTSIYATMTALGYVIGALLSKLVLHQGWVTLDQSFTVAAAIGFCAVVIPLIFVRETPEGIAQAAASEEQHHHTPSDLPVWKLAKSIRASSFATFLTGFFQSASVLFMPLFLIRERGLAREDTTLVVALSCAGMLVLANPAGRLGDRFGHLLIMRVLAMTGVIGLMGFLVIPSFPWLGLAIFAGGGSLVAIPPLSLALQGVIVSPRDYERSNSLFNVAFALGLLLGPPLSGWTFDRMGGQGVIYLFMGLWSAFVIASVFWRRDDPHVASSKPIGGVSP